MAHKPKVCFVSQNVYPLLNKNSGEKLIGGAELQQALMGQELAKRGYRVSYITMNHGQKTVEQIGPFEVISTFRPDDGLPVVRFIYPRLTKIWRALCRSDAEIYYVRGASFILAPVVAFAKRRQKKVIYCGAIDPDFDAEKVILSTFREKMMYFWGLRRCDAIVAQNKTQQRLLLNNFGRNAQIIHNGFFRVDRDPDPKREVLWVATFRTPKNPHLFIELARRIPSETFIMIGGSPRNRSPLTGDIYASVTEAAKTVSNLDFKGPLPFEEVEQWFMRAQVFVNTSKHEGFPNTFLQAWSRGIPVVSFEDPDDLIKEYSLGLVVKDLDEMEQGVRDILEGKINFPSRKIKSFFENNLTIDNMVDKYENLFLSLAA
jgi:glycosyltransferase involved in cell wall biosynthesis